MQTRRTRVEDQNLVKRNIMIGLITLGMIIGLLFYGPQIITQFSLALSSKKVDIPAEKKGKAFLFPPTFDPLPDATNSAKIRIRGTAQPDTTVKVKQNDTTEIEAFVGNDGAFFLNDIVLSKGTNTFIGITEKDEQTSKPSDALTITFNKQPPKLEINHPTDGQHFIGEQNSVLIDGMTTNDSKVTINDRIVPVESSGDFSYSLKLSEGDNVIKIKAVDTAGNELTRELKVSYTK